uniref:Uncharacterized protein n=1 Tax=Setaria digitata TaxID=48799 RepID=A0A915PP16_9BILA
MDLKNNWIKYDFGDFKKYPRPVAILENWTWLLNFLRVMFLIVGALVMLITTCALCGFACMLSTIVRDDYYRRRQIRQREEDLRNLEERLQEVGINIHFNGINGYQEWRQENNEINTAMERSSTASERSSTRAATALNNEISNSSSSSISYKQIALQDDTVNDEMETIIDATQEQSL